MKSKLVLQLTMEGRVQFFFSSLLPALWKCCGRSAIRTTGACRFGGISHGFCDSAMGQDQCFVGARAWGQAANLSHVAVTQRTRILPPAPRILTCKIVLA